MDEIHTGLRRFFHDFDVLSRSAALPGRGTRAEDGGPLRGSSGGMREFDQLFAGSFGGSAMVLGVQNRKRIFMDSWLTID